MSKLNTLEDWLNNVLPQMSVLTPKTNSDEYQMCIYNPAVGVYDDRSCIYKYVLPVQSIAPCATCIAPSPARLNEILTGLRPVM